MTGSLDFSASTSFLLSQIGAEMATRFARRLADFEVAPREFAAMAQINHKGPRTQQQLANSLGIHRNNMTALVDALIAKGLAERTDNPNDRRAVHVILTAAGRGMMEATSAIAPDLDDSVVDALGIGEADDLNWALHALANHLGLATAIHPHFSAAFAGGRSESTA